MSLFDQVSTVISRDPWGTIVFAVVVWWVIEEIRKEAP
jgi:hypothetical protein